MIGRESYCLSFDMKSELIYPSCNIETIRDKRGGIFTWLPDEPIVEFNLLYFTPQATRGNHHHPHFNEYFIVVEGSGAMVYIDTETKEKHILHMSVGSCVKNPMGVSHAFYAITPCTTMAFLTKRWDLSEPPIIHDHVTTENRVES